MLVGTLFFAYKLDANTGEEIWKQSPDPKFASMSGLMGQLDKGGANLSADMQPVGLFITTPHAPELCFMRPDAVPNAPPRPAFAGAGVIVSVPTEDADGACQRMQKKGARKLSSSS